MKYASILLLLVGLFFAQCGSNDDDDDQDTRCAEIEQELIDALDQKLSTFQAYTQNPADPNNCNNYKAALQNRIEKLQKSIDEGCETNATLPFTQQAISEDQASINGLGC